MTLKLYFMKCLERKISQCILPFRNFTKFTGKHLKHLCQSLLFNKVAGLRPATVLKKRLWHRCFPVNFVKFLRTPFYKERLWWLLMPKNICMLVFHELSQCLGLRTLRNKETEILEIGSKQNSYREYLFCLQSIGSSSFFANIK